MSFSGWDIFLIFPQPQLRRGWWTSWAEVMDFILLYRFFFIDFLHVNMYSLDSSMYLPCTHSLLCWRRFSRALFFHVYSSLLLYTFFSMSVNFLFGFLLSRVSAMSVYGASSSYTIITSMYYLLSLDNDNDDDSALQGKYFMEEFLFTPSTVDWKFMFMKKALITERVNMAVVWVICKFIFF